MRDVEEIQADIRQAANRLAEFLPGLGLSRLAEELDEYDPEDPEECEAMGTDEVCPTLAWGVGCDLAGAIDEVEGAVDSLREAADATAESVRAEWLERVRSRRR